MLKEHGNHVQILTKGDGSRDFDLLDENDWYGVTIDGSENNSLRGFALALAREQNVKTWISFEPVLDAERVLWYIKEIGRSFMVDKIKIGKLNYYPSAIDWKAFGKEAELLCQMYGIDYYIKDSLRKEMVKE